MSIPAYLRTEFEHTQEEQTIIDFTHQKEKQAAFLLKLICSISRAESLQKKWVVLANAYATNYDNTI